MKNPFLVKTVRILAAVAMLSGVAVAGCAPKVENPTTTVVEKVTRTLNIGVADFGSDVLDPMMAKTETQAIAGFMFDGLFQGDADGKLTPWVLKKWEIAPDSLSWTFYLRDDVFFHDGSKCTAEDIAFSLGYAQRDEAFSGAYWRATLDNPPKTQIIDQYTLRVYTPKPVPALARRAITTRLYIVPKAYIEKNGVDYFRAHPIGTGPYKFVRQVRGDSVELEAVDHYWTGVVPDFDRVTIFQVPEATTRIAMLQTGKLDFTPVGLEDSIDLKKKGFSMATGMGGSVGLNFIGTYLPEAKGKPLSDIRVRQALSLAINRQEIVDTLLGGLGQVPVSPPRLSWSNTDLGPDIAKKWTPWFKENYRYDPAEAKRLLNEAGYPNGFTFDFWVAPDAAAPYMIDTVTTCAGYWKKLGIDVVIVPVDAATWKANRNTLQSNKLVGKGGVNASDLFKATSTGYIAYFTSKYEAAANYLIGSPLEAKMDALYLESLSTLDPARYQQILDQAIEIAANTWTNINVVAAPITFALGPRVKNDAKIRPGIDGACHDIPNWKYSGVEPKK